LKSRYYTDLLTLFVDETNLGNADALVDAVLILIRGRKETSAARTGKIGWRARRIRRVRGTRGYECHSVELLWLENRAGAGRLNHRRSLRFKKPPFLLRRLPAGAYQVKKPLGNAV
jgi:hypothetical protein